MEWMASGLIHKKLFTKEFAMTMNKDASKGLVGEDAAPRVIMPTMIEIEMDENGLIQNCNDICESVIGFGRDELKLRHISTLINMFSHMPVMSGDKLNPYLDFICHCGLPFGVRKKTDGDFLFCRLNIISPQHPQVAKFKLLASPLYGGAGRI